MKSHTKKFRFPGITGTVHQTGQQLSESAGVNVVLHYADGAKVPHACEVHSDDASEYAELGLESEDGERITGYDGAFELPAPVVVALLFEGIECDANVIESPRLRAWNASAALLRACRHGLFLAESVAILQGNAEAGKIADVIRAALDMAAPDGFSTAPSAEEKAERGAL